MRVRHKIKGPYLGATVEQHKLFVTVKMLCGATVTATQEIGFTT
jgi:hypothetical protein